MKKAIKKISGFTIVELAVVMVVIGVLSAIAAPRIMNLYKNSKRASILGIMSVFRANLASIRSQWVLEGSPDYVSAPASGMYLFMKQLDPNNANDKDGVVKGFGTTTNDVATLDANMCSAIWYGVLGGEAPIVSSTDSSCLQNKSCMYYVTISGQSCYFTDKNNNSIYYYRGTGDVGTNSSILDNTQNI